MRPTTLLRHALAAPLVALLAVAPSPVAGQVLLDQVEDLDPERPEAWAMQWFASAALLSGLGPPRVRDPWTVELGLEAGWLPELSEEERRVGFDGVKVEDLNRAEAFGRLRIDIGLPKRLTLTAAWVPPVSVDGLEANLVSLALSRPIAGGRRWSLGARLHATGGEVEGDITCDRATVAAGDDPVRNPFLCTEPSGDEVTLRTAGVELTARGPELRGRVRPYLAAGGEWHDHEFQVDARYGGIVDRTRLLTDDFTWHLAAGAEARLTEAARLAGELYYVPLEVARPPDRRAETEELVNLRLLLSWRLR